jgi:hypothetical protein
MIVRFTLTPLSVHLHGISEERRSKVLRNITMDWGDIGRFVIYGGKCGERAVLQEIKQIKDTELRKLWEIALKKYEYTVKSDDLSFVISDEVEQSRRLELICHNNNEDFECKIIEKAPLGQFTETDVIYEAKVRAKEPICNTDSPQKLWRSRIEPIAEMSKKITIIDRYCFSGVENTKNWFLKKGSTRLLDYITQSNPNKLQVYAALGDKNSDEWLRPQIFNDIKLGMEWLLERCSFLNHRLTAQFLPDEVFAKKAHERFIYFDYQMVQLGPGIEVFGKEKYRDNSSFLLKMRSPKDNSRLNSLICESEDKYKISL